ncbi:MAG: hypothetical protein KAT65_14125, partial [Methanophagales archaeon]|nr:hypothetical protein [Methanophagales archaeon]
MDFCADNAKEKCKSQSSTEGANERLEVKRAHRHSHFIFCIFQFTLGFLQLIARNPQDFEQLRFHALQNHPNIPICIPFLKL